LVTTGTYVADQLKKSKYDFVEETACPVHALIGYPVACALGYPRQRAYLIMFDVGRHCLTLETGKQVPPGFEIQQ
jgi:hypothetical protein